MNGFLSPNRAYMCVDGIVASIVPAPTAPLINEISVGV
jgi:hypothetical protein